MPSMIQTSIDPNRAAAVGMFDGVHCGHTALVKELVALAKERNMIPTIFTFDRHPMELTAPGRVPKLLTTPTQRGQLLHHAGAEDVFVLVFNEVLKNFTAGEFLEALRDHYGVHMILLGFNHHFGHDHIESFDEYRALGEKYGIEVVRAKSVVEDSDSHVPVCSSDIRDLIAEGRVEKAAEMLGHPYRLTGVVVHGFAVGHKIGYPTANLSEVIGRQLMPAEGVYAAAALLPDIDRFKKYPAMVNIGRRPTVNESLRPELTVETHIIGFDGDLYGHYIDLRFLARIRDEQAFESIDDLARQLDRDKETTLRIFASKK